MVSKPLVKKSVINTEKTRVHPLDKQAVNRGNIKGHPLINRG